MDVAKAGNRERGTGNQQGEREDENWEQNEVADRARFQVRFCFQFFIFPFPMLVPRSPFPVPRSPFPVPRSPFPVPSLSNIPLVCTGRKNGFTGNGVGIGVVSGAVRAHMTFWTSEMGVASGVIRETESESEAEAEGQTSHNARSHAWFSSSASARDSDGPVFTWS